MTETKGLEVVEKKVDLEVAKDLSPKEFYQSRKGLYVFSSFVERVVEKAETTAAGAKLAVSSFVLTKDMTDAEIEAELPEKHVFTETEVCAVVAELIAKQPKGEEGALLSNGNFNLFYTGAFVVFVRWGGGGWGVCAWERDVSWWFSGRRVFSPVN